MADELERRYQVAKLAIGAAAARSAAKARQQRAAGLLPLIRRGRPRALAVYCQNGGSLHGQVIGDGQQEPVALPTKLDGVLPGGQRRQHHVVAISHHGKVRPRLELPGRRWPYFADEIQDVVSREREREG